jgi:[ribosomal protein S5]-alanine N-acetyltransferase
VNLTVAPPTPGDREEVLAAVAASRDLHHPWVSPPADVGAFDTWVSGIGERRQSWLLRDGDRLVGVVNANEIVRRALQSTYLGYYGFAGGIGGGRMTRGLGLVLNILFDDIGLHRAEANLQPDNPASRALVRRLGFRLEGFSPAYLRVNGAWRDHERWAILAPEWKAHDRS